MEEIMKEATKRSIFRWIHIIFAIPIAGYIYSPFDQIPNYAFPTRFIFVPVLVLRDCGCGRATSFDDLSRKDWQPVQVLTGTYDLRFGRGHDNIAGQAEYCGEDITMLELLGNGRPKHSTYPLWSVS